jgi:hypothetical protein
MVVLTDEQKPDQVRMLTRILEGQTANEKELRKLQYEGSAR